MCRFLAYSGSPIYLDELVFKARHSLIEQSRSARASTTTTNGDGFGLGWYGTREAPGQFRDTRPAWNDRNLLSLTEQIRSSLFLAHVRAATGSAVQRTNCHPFRHQRWLFVHNGTVREFERLKRTLVCGVSPELYPEIEGSTDSEVLFYLALSFGLDGDPFGALARTASFVEAAAREHGVADALFMTVALTDGQRLIALRYSTEGGSPTLYHSASLHALKELHPALERFPDDAVVVVSEPLSDLTDAWREVPEATALVVERGSVQRRPFEPQPVE